MTIHAGEWAGAENVREAVEMLGADRIGHGIRSVEDPALIDLLLSARDGDGSLPDEQRAERRGRQISTFTR